MTYLEGILLLLGLCSGLTLSGYWLAAMLGEFTPAERLAVSLLAGLCSLLLVVSMVNLFLPLTFPWNLLCLVPCVGTLALKRTRGLLWADLAAFGRDRETVLVGALLAISFGLLLWPLLSDPLLLFYDGSPNHDSFFWVASAEYLKRHTYMEPGGQNPFQPLFNATDSIIGLKPAWGRMGTEGLLALVASLSGTSPLKMYHYATVSLFLPWTAAVFLTAKAFFNRKLSASALIGLALFQPIFVFYYSNANLPNLFGVLTGATAVLATEQALRTPAQHKGSLIAWLLLLVLAVHGLLCAYPEMLPFVGLPCALLWLRRWFARSATDPIRPLLLTGGAAVAGLLINQFTTFRAVNGFVEVFRLARANENYASILTELEPFEYLPALSTLALPAADSLGFWLGLPLSLLLLACLFLALWRAHDRLGALMIFSGGAAMLLYTLATDFAYGWQKTVQFCGVFVATAIPVGTMDALARERHLPDSRRWLAWAGTLSIAAFMGYTTIMSCLDVHQWSNRKTISSDWLVLREYSRGPLRGERVVIDSPSFPTGFFHGMWSTYFLPESRLYFTRRGENHGGYISHSVAQEDIGGQRNARAVLVARPWAEAFDINSPRILLGREFVLLRQANRITEMRGVYPREGVPIATADHFSISARINAASHLSLELSPNPAMPLSSISTGSWQVINRVGETEHRYAPVAGPPPWKIEVPLAGHQTQTVSFAFSAEVSGPLKFPFVLSHVRLVSEPVSLSSHDGSIDFSSTGNWTDYLVSGVSVNEKDEAIAASPEAVLQFVPGPAASDVELQLVAVPHFGEKQEKILPVQFWFNDHLVFESPFIGPGVLRTRILAQHWNEKPVATVRLRYPAADGRSAGKQSFLILHRLTTNAASAMP